MSDLEQMQDLVNKLNDYRDSYYNNNESIISDKEYDDLYDQLVALETKLGTSFSNSPTQTVGYVVQGQLRKVSHDHKMLSLNKTKDVSDVVKFAAANPLIGMLKMDGLTVSLHYDSRGNLAKAETRGNGEVGEDVLENAKQITNIPLKINNHGKPFTIDGEVIVDLDTFDKINSKLEQKYSHPRNLASGSIRQLDTKITKARKLSFIGWRVIEGCSSDWFDVSLNFAKQLGFTVVPFMIVNDPKEETLTYCIDKLKVFANQAKYPIDGIVFSYEDMTYGNSLGETSHHPQHSFAFKFYDDVYETILRDVEWNPTRTGIIAPVAVFDPVDLDGAITSRATLHNISIMKDLELGIGDTIMVYRANAVIPKVHSNLTKSNTYKFPTTCPSCGSKTIIKQEGEAEVMYCSNPDCDAKVLAKFVHFVSKGGVDVGGLSEATLDKLLELGILQTYKDLYHLTDHVDKLMNIEGMGKTSVNKLLKAIEESRSITLDRFINALGIPQIGTSASKTLSKYFAGDYTLFIHAVDTDFDFTELSDFGKVANNAIYKFFGKNSDMVNELAKEFKFASTKETVEVAVNSFINGKTFVITGSFSKPRKYYEELIVNNNGKLSSSVSKKTDYLLTNDTSSGSSKNQKAAELGIPVMTEEEFIAKTEEVK